MAIYTLAGHGFRELNSWENVYRWIVMLLEIVTEINEMVSTTASIRDGNHPEISMGLISGMMSNNSESKI